MTEAEEGAKEKEAGAAEENRKEASNETEQYKATVRSCASTNET